MASERDENDPTVLTPTKEIASLRAYIVKQNAILDAVRAEAQEWLDAPPGEMAPCQGVGRIFMSIIELEETR